jgi:tryptophan halogenase
MGERVANLAIVGGGAAAWLAAAVLARSLRPDFCSVQLIETSNSNAPGSIAALPAFHRLNAVLGIDETDLLRNTSGIFSLGSRFRGFGGEESYFHAYGSVGAKLEAVPFHQYWLKLRQAGEAEAFGSYSVASSAAAALRFCLPNNERASILSSFSYGYHFKEAALAAYLRRYATAHGVRSSKGTVARPILRGDDGGIEALLLEDGTRIAADFFIDCSGGATLLEAALGVGREDWSRWLTCDHALTTTAQSSDPLAPYTDCIAVSEGWAWHTPLRQEADVGLAYSSRFTSQEQALQQFESLPHANVASVRTLRLSPGRAKKFWDRNCLMLATDPADPLEATPLHLLQTGIARFLAHFPRTAQSPDDAEEYNRLTAQEHDRIRDFKVLHFYAAQRADSPFWQHCRDMQLPDSLLERIEVFRASGRVALLDEEHFSEESWLTVLFGQGVLPQRYDPLADVLPVGEVSAAFKYLRALIGSEVAQLPSLSAFMARQCPLT